MKWEAKQAKIDYDANDTIINKLAKIRGIEDIDLFLNPTADHLFDPYLLDNIEELANRIILAIKRQERICVSADCDSDGIFSTAIMVRYLRQFTDNVYYIFAQRSEGHGIEYQKDKVEDGTNLLIILDSSSNSVDACKELQMRNIDIVILDHHEIEKENPYATIVNPKRDGDTYPNKEISGATLAYKAISVVDDTLASGTPEDYLDLVACGMYADMMSVNVPENRYIITQGMKNIANKGVKALLKLNKVDEIKVTSNTIGFTISPMINGVARMDKIELAMTLLLEDDFVICYGIAEQIKVVNEERKRIQRELLEICEAQVVQTDKIIIAICEESTKGFNGLIANDLAQRYKRPAMVLRSINGTLVGSYRTYGDFKLKSFLNKFHHIGYAAGHEEAGGTEFKEMHLDLLKEFIDRNIKQKSFAPKVEYDFELQAKDVHFKLVKEIEQFDYLTGKDMPPAKILVKDLFVEDRKVQGKTKNTVKIMCDNSIECIKFRTDSLYAVEIEAMDQIHVVGSLSINQWFSRNGMITTNQIIIDDYFKSR